MILHPIAKFADKFWVVECISSSGLATLWRNGESIFVHKDLIKFQN